MDTSRTSFWKSLSFIFPLCCFVCAPGYLSAGALYDYAVAWEPAISGMSDPITWSTLNAEESPTGIGPQDRVGVGADGHSTR